MSTRIELLTIDSQRAFIVRGTPPTDLREHGILEAANFQYDNDLFPGAWATRIPKLRSLPTEMWVPYMGNKMILGVEVVGHATAGFSFAFTNKTFCPCFNAPAGTGVLTAEARTPEDVTDFTNAVTALGKAISLVRDVLVFTPTPPPRLFTTVQALCDADNRDKSPGTTFTFMSGDGLRLDFRWASKDCNRDESDDWDEDTVFTHTGKRVIAARKVEART